MVLKGTQESGAGKIAFEKKKNAEDRDSSEKCNFQSCVRQTDSSYIEKISSSELTVKDKASHFLPPLTHPPNTGRKRHEPNKTNAAMQVSPRSIWYNTISRQLYSLNAGRTEGGKLQVWWYTHGLRGRMLLRALIHIYLRHISQHISHRSPYQEKTRPNFVLEMLSRHSSKQSVSVYTCVSSCLLRTAFGV